MGLIIQATVSMPTQGFFVYRIYICAYGPPDPYLLMLTFIQLAEGTL